jgi:flagellar L-ring protein precursor FlgH
MRKTSWARLALVALVSVAEGASIKKQRKVDQPSRLDQIIAEAERAGGPPVASPGSLFVPSGPLGNLARDLRASQVNDLVTIVVSDKASAVSRGATSSARKSSASASISSLAGPTRAAGPLASLADLSGDRKLDGQAETSRETELSTTVTARVTHVLPNGSLVVEGSKAIMVNSERQRITIRGITRWNDLSGTNRISSDRLAELEVRVDGKGVVDDAIHRPGFIYRLLMGLLPF